MAPALRVVEANMRVYRRVWKGSAITSFVTPLLYLAAMGLGLGTLVDRGTGTAELGAVGYLDFLAPGLLAATAMQSAAGEAAWPIVAGIKWRRTFEAVLSTPVGVADLVAGTLAWQAIRLVLSTVAFALVVQLFGVGEPLGWVGAVGAGVLTGMAVGAPLTAYSATLERDQALASVFRFGIVPMFLFSGAFFPVEQLPDALEPVARITPLWHGVQLARSSVLGVPTALPVSVHLVVLLLLAAAGGATAVRTFRRRLQP